MYSVGINYISLVLIVPTGVHILLKPYNACLIETFACSSFDRVYHDPGEEPQYKLKVASVINPPPMMF